MDGLQIGREMTYGEKAVGLTFNPSNDPKVQKIKELYAEIVDIVINNSFNPETETSVQKKQFTDNAIKEAVTAQMWAVKAITYQF